LLPARGYAHLQLLDPKYDREIDFMRELVNGRQLMAKYLVYGRLLKPLTPTFQLSGASKPQHTTSLPMRVGYSPAGSKSVAHPGIVHAVWQEQNGGTLGIFVLSVISPQYLGVNAASHINVSFSMRLADYGLDPAVAYAAVTVAADGARTPLAKSSAGVISASVQVTDIGRSLAMVEVERE
jgi:hypothetical protein